MKPDNETTDTRWCKFCGKDVRMTIRVEEWVVILTCSECAKVRELERYRPLKDFPSDPSRAAGIARSGRRLIPSRQFSGSSVPA